MMKRIFLDTNILLDLALQREHGHDAEELIRQCDANNLVICASCLSYVNIAYILQHLPLQDIYTYERMLREGVEVLAIDAVQLDYVLSHPSRDFEDMLQFCCAKAGQCDVIITNNAKDFVDFADIPVMPAKEFLEQNIMNEPT